jgi:hypothetical protein
MMYCWGVSFHRTKHGRVKADRYGPFNAGGTFIQMKVTERDDAPASLYKYHKIAPLDWSLWL